jgi:hypothetical protein
MVRLVHRYVSIRLEYDKPCGMIEFQLRDSNAEAMRALQFFSKLCGFLSFATRELSMYAFFPGVFGDSGLVRAIRCVRLAKKRFLDLSCVFVFTRFSRLFPGSGRKAYGAYPVCFRTHNIGSHAQK